MQSILIDQLFDLRNKVNDVVLGHFLDEIEERGFKTVVRDYDFAVKIAFGTDIVDGELVIDRLLHQFWIIATVNGDLVLPMQGDWDLMIRFIDELIVLSAAQQLTLGQIQQ